MTFYVVEWTVPGQGTWRPWSDNEFGSFVGYESKHQAERKINRIRVSTDNYNLLQFRVSEYQRVEAEPQTKGE